MRYSLSLLFICFFTSNGLASTGSSFSDSLNFGDVVVLNNKDVIKCNIISLNKRVLTIKTDYSDSDFKIEWQNVESILSVQHLTIFTKKEGRYYGVVKTTYGADSIPILRVYDQIRGTIDIDLDNVVYIQRVRNTFLDRAYLKLGVGYNWTKAQNIRTSNLFAQARHISGKHMLDINYNYSKTIQDSVPEVFRTNSYISFERLIGKKFLFVIREDFLQNSEQEVKLRLSSSFGPGIIFLYNAYLRAVFSAGTTWNSERFYAEDPRENSLELFGTLDFIVFDWHDLNLSINLNVYPGMTYLGRFRYDNVTTLNYDLPLDFFVGTTLNMNYDNRPTEGASKVDFVYTLNFGWKWDP